MTPEAHRRPGGGGDESTTNVLNSVREPEGIAAQLRRRREAAWRLPPLPDGLRDPLDRLAAQR